MKLTEVYFHKCNRSTFPHLCAASISPTSYLYQIWKKKIAADHLGKLVMYTYCGFVRSGPVRLYVPDP